MKILIIAEHDNKSLKSVNLNTLSAAIELGNEIDLFVIGNDCNNVVEAAKQLPNLQHILVAEAPQYEHQLAENLAPLIFFYLNTSSEIYYSFYCD